MSVIIFLCFVGILYFILAGGGTGFQSPQSSRLPAGEGQYFQVADSLFVNKAERAFFIILSQTLGPDYLLMSKTRLEDIIGVRRDIGNEKLRWSLRGRVKSRHVDFLICARDGRPLMGIELDGASHNEKSAQAGDDLKDRIFAAAGVSFTRISTRDNFEEVARLIAKNLAF